MQLIVFIILYPFLWLISILPFRILYLISDILYIILYNFIGYRKKVVTQNLQLVFPEKSIKEIKKIRRKFYHHLCDMFLEMIKTLTISRESLKKRFIIRNINELNKIDCKDKSAVLMYGHYASYEWSTVIQSHIKNQGLGIYKTIANKYFDRLVKRVRGKYNTELVSSKKALSTIAEYYTTKQHRLIAFLSDQSPKLRPNNVWQDFMGIEVPCFVGAEVTSKKYNLPIAYLKVEKVKRGYYEADIIILSENPSEVKNFEITKQFNRLLEEQIKSSPEYYLWTHKRWKHKDKKPN